MAVSLFVGGGGGVVSAPTPLPLLLLLCLLQWQGVAAAPYPGRLDGKMEKILVDEVNEKFDAPTLFGMYRVRKVKSRGVGLMIVEFDVKETVCSRPQVQDQGACEFSRTASPALWECKAFLLGVNTEAPIVRFLRCEPNSSEESDSDSSEERVRWVSHSADR